MKFLSAIFFAGSIAAVAAQDDDCAAEYIVEACLSSTQPKVDACVGNDWSCLCSAYTDVATCYNNCPKDSRAFSAGQQVDSYCRAASAAVTTTTSTSSSTASGSVSAATSGASTTSGSSTASGSLTAEASATISSESSAAAAEGLKVGGVAVLAVIAAML